MLKASEIHTSRVDLNTLCDMVLMMAARVGEHAIEGNKLEV